MLCPSLKHKNTAGSKGFAVTARIPGKKQKNISFFDFLTEMTGFLTDRHRSSKKRNIKEGLG
jgi:hypothetical protein